jgi:adenylate kinase family enzyme
MRHPILFLEENKEMTRCPIDGSKLVKREGLDDPETIKVRIKEFGERTFPVLEFLKNRGIPVIMIDGTKCPAEVFGNIMDKIK